MKSDNIIHHTESFGKISETIILIVGVLLFLLLLYLMLPSFSPFLLVAAILFLLYPARKHLYVRRFLWLTLLLFLAWFFTSILGVLVPFILAFLIAYIFDPLVSNLERRKIPRWLSSLIIILLILGTIVAFFIIFIPIIVSQSKSIVESTSAFVESATSYFKEGRLVDLLTRLGLPAAQVQDFLSKELPPKIGGAVKAIINGIVGMLTNISAVITQLLNLVIIPFAAFYLLKDFPLVFERVRTWLPAQRKEAIITYFRRVDEMLGQYLRGVLIVAFIQGTLTAIGLVVLGIQYGVVLGIITGILNLIPYAGFYTSLVFSIIAAMLSGGSIGFNVIAVILLYVGLNLLETTIWSPRIIGHQVGLHPVVLILSLVVFGFFLGFVGLLIAVPTAALIFMSIELWLERLRLDETINPEEE